MQIDFHHTTTYVVARAAGFEHDQAQIIAYASQYVDDATSTGTVRFDNQAVYNRISSAHKMLDARNTEELANHQVWLAFHFLPGNGGKQAGEDPDGSFINKIVCRPNSPAAQEMVRGVILEKDRSYGLHRLGVAMHVYVDTWVDQQFDHAFTKLASLVRDYPDDAEIRTIYALFVNSFRSDTTEAIAHLDTVLAQHPATAFALLPYANL